MINYGKDGERENDRERDGSRDSGWGLEKGEGSTRELSMIYCNLIVAHYAVDLGF